MPTGLRKKPLVSVIIPVYNGERFLEEAIESVLVQTYENFELLIVNDGSTDDSSKIITKFAKKDKRIVSLSQKNQGQSSARNFGVKKSKGVYIAFLDQDDRYIKTKIEKTIEFLEKNKEFAMVYSDIDVLDKNGRVITTHALTCGLPPIPQVQHPKRSLFECLGSDMFILPGASVVRKDIFEEVGGFDHRLSGYEDDDLFFRIFLKYRIGFLKESLLQWRIYSESYSYSSRMEKSRLIYFKKLCEMFPDDPSQDNYWIRDIILPRFFNTYIMQLYLARKRKNVERLKQVAQDFEEIQPKPFGVQIQFFLLKNRFIPFWMFHLLKKVYRLVH